MWIFRTFDNQVVISKFLLLLTLLVQGASCVQWLNTVLLLQSTKGLQGSMNLVHRATLAVP